MPAGRHPGSMVTHLPITRGVLHVDIKFNGRENIVESRHTYKITIVIRGKQGATASPTGRITVHKNV